MPVGPSDPDKLVKESRKPGLFTKAYRSVFGEPGQDTDWPELESEYATVSRQMPSESAGVAGVRDFNVLDRLIQPNAYAITYPWGSVAVNRPAVEEHGQDLGDVLTHELTHVGQRQNESLLDHLRKIIGAKKDYFSRDYEKEALQSEKERPMRRSDIELPSTWTRVNGS